MIGRRQLTVASPISPSSLVGALVDSVGDAVLVHSRARDLVMREFGARAAVLTDSGTSALVLALRLAAPNGGIVAYPGYACVDLAAAARYAGVRVRLYDLDPATLGPDLESLRRTLDRGVDAVVVAHLFGYPVDVPTVRRVAASYGVTVIEDAAQGAGGTLEARRLGSFGEMSVISFGRGKGLCAGGGGALIASGDPWAERIDNLQLEATGRGLSALVKTGIQWTLGRPSLYALPSMIPWLHLGEMVYHPAHEPVGMSAASAALISTAFSLETEDLEIRRRNASALAAAVSASADLRATVAIQGAMPGFLRFAVRDVGGRRAADASIGVARPYPRTLSEQPELRPVLIADEPATPGAAALRASLFTLPTHRFVAPRDLAALDRWVRAAPSPNARYTSAHARSAGDPTS